MKLCLLKEIREWRGWGLTEEVDSCYEMGTRRRRSHRPGEAEVKRARKERGGGGEDRGDSKKKNWDAARRVRTVGTVGKEYLFGEK